MRTRVVAIALSFAFGCSNATYPSKRMADGKQWTTANLNVNTSSSYSRHSDTVPGSVIWDEIQKASRHDFYVLTRR